MKNDNHECCNIIKTLWRGIIIVIISVIIGGILMVGTYHLPTQLMFSNVKKSIPLLNPLNAKNPVPKRMMARLTA